MTSAVAPITPELANAPEPFSSNKPSLIGMTQTQLRAVASEFGSPAFRGDQLHHWLYVLNERNPDNMTNLSKSFREQVFAHYQVGCLEKVSRQNSKDGTIKYLFRLNDGEVVESVLMAFQNRGTYSICLSTQVGCAMNCSFCATGKLGFTRHLTVAEIVDQYLFVQADSQQEIRNVVLMGQGEPLHNYDNTLAALRILNESAEVGMRRITLSTSGIVPDIDRLAKEELPLTLAVSLHAPTNEIRSQIMPINKKYPLEALMPSLHRYMEASGRRLTIEYLMIDGLNDSPDHADQLGRLLKGLRANVNLIPYNPISKSLPNVPSYRRPSRERVFHFSERLTSHGKKVTVRLERGVDIDAACGQLANRQSSKR
jgi:23S rRNA (adenine2503-C2)-methyltransferase